MATVQIRDLKVRVIVGVEEWERNQEQDILVNVSFNYDSARAAQTDGLVHAVDYKSMADDIVCLLKSSRFNLLEKMVQEVLKLVMARALVNKASVTISKPDALKSALAVDLTLSAERVL